MLQGVRRLQPPAALHPHNSTTFSDYPHQKVGTMIVTPCPLISLRSILLFFSAKCTFHFQYFTQKTVNIAAVVAVRCLGGSGGSEA